MTDTARAETLLPDPFETLEDEVDAAIAICDGDVRAALRATLVANAYLENEFERLATSISTGFDRQRIRKMRKPVRIKL